ncbi:hypothetical protein DCCM_3296 [Desulfocucumis palustris]|uniref:Glycoside hydrolase family 5 domain-containing protein n=1 Tax=Desulfocucumis palustris TaxID=1898651 RepID=A0A2L2XDT2_9FIRM|nr:hypothetical protein [Desulfocucumis palustris]GBF34184.1 hypothetical protein DCCM_3296 [Desulfocucumis palustris]
MLELTFGIYPLSVAGTPFGLAVGPPDNYGKIQLALQDLKGESKKLFPRNYLIYTKEWESKMLSLADRYLDAGLLGDLTLGCGDWTHQQEIDIEMDNWLDFIRKVINRYGSHLASLQITNEPNLSFMEGSKPYILNALVEGVIAAKKETRKRNLPLKIGFGSVPESPAAVPRFWENLSKAGGKTFIDSVDFVGHNFYLDVFDEQPLDLKEIPASVKRTLRNLREKDLVTAGIPASVPIRVTENGWPTGKNPVANIDRSYEHQAKVLETIIRTIYNLRQELIISHYELFGLRDADSSKEDLFYQFGITRDDYSPKPAYYTFKKLIQELGI